MPESDLSLVNGIIITKIQKVIDLLDIKYVIFGYNTFSIYVE
jgi:hypothetical protein